jgi:hypothetical protein
MVPRGLWKPWLAGIGTLSLLIFSMACNLGNTSAAGSSTGSTQSAAQVVVSVSPENVSVPSGQTAQFTAAVRGTSNTAVAWAVASINGIPAVGTINASGLYTAPAGVNSNTQVAVKATSMADQTASASAVVTVTTRSNPAGNGSIGVNIAPLSTTIPSGGTLQFWDAVSGTSNTAVTWTAKLGTINASGLYVAPNTSTQVVDTVTVTSAADATQSAQATITVAAQGSTNPGLPASFFGLHINEISVPWPTVPFASYRSLDSGNILWADINTAEGQYDWSHLDPWIAKAQAGGQDILYTMFGTPSWASSRGLNSSNPDTGCSFVPVDGPGVCDAPDDLNADGTGTDQHWKDFVTALINHVGTGTVKYWEIWNEWNISNQWNGTQAQMLRLAQDAQAILKANDPNALITSPSVVNADLAAKNWLLGYFQAGGGQYADIVAVHGYVSTPTTVCPSACPVPENVAAVLDNTRAVMAAAGQQGKPLFDTEGSWGVTSDMTDPDVQVEFTGRFYLIQLGGTTASPGFDKFYWFGWDYTNTGGFYDPNSGQITPAGVAYQQIYNWSVGAVTSRCAPSGTQWACGFSRSGGYQAEAIWDTSQSCANGNCTTLSVSVDPQYVQYRDLAGAVTPIVNNTVAVGGKPILLENGNPN